MGLISLLFGLPLAPMRGLIRLAEILRDQADQELHSPAAARSQLEAIAEARASGEISEGEEAEAMRRISERMLGPVASSAEGREEPA